jgi:hypothetical protein
MYCDVNDPTLVSIYPGKSSTYISRNVTDGTMLASLWYKGVEQFYCRADKCGQRVDSEGSYLWECESVECLCIPGSAFCGGPGVVFSIETIIPDIVGSIELKFPGQELESGELYCKC